MARIRPYPDKDNADLVVRMLLRQQSTLRTTCGIVWVMVLTLLGTVLLGMLSPWTLLISVGALLYGLYNAHSALNRVNNAVVEAEREKALFDRLWSCHLVVTTKKVSPNRALDWLEANAPSGSLSGRVGELYVFFPDEDSRVLFRLSLM